MFHLNCRIPVRCRWHCPIVCHINDQLIDFRRRQKFRLKLDGDRHGRVKAVVMDQQPYHSSLKLGYFRRDSKK